MIQPFIVHIIDDDASVRHGFHRLMDANDLQSATYASAAQFLDETDATATAKGCILLDISMPGMTGIDLQASLKNRGVTLPVIAVSARNDDQMRSLTRQLGARFFLHKPVDDQALLDAIAWVCEMSYTEMREGRAA